MDDRRGGFRGNRGSGDRRGGFRGDRDPKEMHKAVCADCKNECEVPFKPTEDRPVYCRDCFRNHKRF
ncbi:DNA-directed RNA polymerase [Candidatus Woesearchaeota archaeon]|nr:DNA-directed RNA polymerase [Candidatus Woesearchaeota archaeon]